MRRHHERIFALCRRLSGNRDDALDATQEALFTIARRIDRFDGRSSFGTWAYRVATNACLDELRRRKRRPLPVDPTDPEPTNPLRAESTQGQRPGLAGGQADDYTNAIVERFQIDAALAQLPEEFRVAVVLRDLLTLDYAQIAAVTEAPIGTVRSRIARGRALLAKQLAEAGNPSPAEIVQPSPKTTAPPAADSRPARQPETPPRP